MHPVICDIGPLTVYSYGLCLAVAFFVSSALAGQLAKRQGLPAEAVFNFAFLVFICGIIGARALYVLNYLRDYLGHPLEIVMLQHGGLAWFGGLAAGICAGIIYLKLKGIGLWQMLDLVAPFAALGQSIGRLGCFFNGCCYGRSFGVPAQVISSFLLLAVYVVLRRRQEVPHKNGEIFFLYLLLYALKRFLVEFIRADNPLLIGRLSLFHLLSIALFVFSAAGLILIRSQGTRPQGTSKRNTCDV
jgi:phosphatidylglycerol:prolipoprotein diacylglycerol transferase